MPRAAIFGLSGLTLTPDEQAFLASAQPFGVILFRRNIESAVQLADLMTDIKSTVPGIHVFVDQEGGRVQRLLPPVTRISYPAAGSFLAGAGGDIGKAAANAAASYQQLASEIRGFGFTVNCAPVLDVLMDNTTDAIGQRAFGHDPEAVARVGEAVIRAHLEAGIRPVIKHMPGHGRAVVDSHLELPRVKADPGELRNKDLLPFRHATQTFGLQIWGMSSHMLFEDIDDQPTTFSKPVVQDLIRGEIGFKGLLMTDDLDMKALSGPLGQRAEKAFAAGHDLVMQCNGDLPLMKEVASVAPVMSSSLMV